MLDLQNIQYKVGQKQILTNVNIAFEPGQIHMVLGPNGSGKTSLLKIASGQNHKFQGKVIYGAQSLDTISPSYLAKYRSYLSQQSTIAFPLTVKEVVNMGRYPHFEYQLSKHDHDITAQVIEKLEIQQLQNRDFNTLSGGEQQRVQFARVLSQVWEPVEGENRYLFLDEPLNNLDIQYQKAFLELIQGFLQKDIVIIMIVHDINWAFSYADKVYFLKEGQLIAHGSPIEIINTNLIKNVFSVSSRIVNLPDHKFPQVVF